MFKNKNYLIAFIVSIILISGTFYGFATSDSDQKVSVQVTATDASDSADTATTSSDSSNIDQDVDPVLEKQYAKVVGEYKQYLNSLPANVRNEIVSYRKAISALNKQKTELYGKLSPSAKSLLKKERDIRKKLPIKDKATFSRVVKKMQESAK